MKTGNVFNIQHFSVHDGPGIRTTVFMKGCPLRCKWCHNPEGLEGRRQLRYDGGLCISCGLCAEECARGVHKFENGIHDVKFSDCGLCERCVNICPAKALEVSGQLYTPSKLIDEIMKDKCFYGSEGGVTFSGGEPLMQSEFIGEVMERIHGDINGVLDTSGYADWRSFEHLLPYFDLFLYDLKASSRDVHLSATGVSNELIVDNLKRLDGCGKEIWIRIPLIPGVNDSEAELSGLADIIAGLRSVRRTTIMPYHKLGVSKYAAVGMKCSFNSDITYTREQLESIRDIFIKRGIDI